MKIYTLHFDRYMAAREDYDRTGLLSCHATEAGALAAMQARARSVLLGMGPAWTAARIPTAGQTASGTVTPEALQGQPVAGEWGEEWRLAVAEDATSPLNAEIVATDSLSVTLATLDGTTQASFTFYIIKSPLED